MKITILTPTFNSSVTLPASIESVSRQKLDRQTELEHVVMDGGSSDGTADLVKSLVAEKQHYRFTGISEPDRGMYNALNKAFDESSGDIIGHLNSDEQYLPGTLQEVVSFFESRPDVDVLFGGVVIIDPSGDYICSRLPIKPEALHTKVCHLATLTASMFFRRSAIEQLGKYFDESYKTAGDADLICRMLKAKLNMATSRHYFSLFIDSGDNLAETPQARGEMQRLRMSVPAVLRSARRFLEGWHKIRKFAAGAYRLEPFSYEFINADQSVTHKDVPQPTGVWVTRRKKDEKR